MTFNDLKGHFNHFSVQYFIENHLVKVNRPQSPMLLFEKTTTTTTSCYITIFTKNILSKNKLRPEGAKKKFGDRPRPFPKGLDHRPLSPPPLPRPLIWHGKVLLQNGRSRYDFVQPTLEAVVSYNHLIRHLSRWERKG